jgi:hypothetical protein
LSLSIVSLRAAAENRVSTARPASISATLSPAHKTMQQLAERKSNGMEWACRVLLLCPLCRAALLLLLYILGIALFVFCGFGGKAFLFCFLEMINSFAELMVFVRIKVAL